MKKRKRTLRRWADVRIRRYCRKLTDKQRKVVVGTAFILFLTGSLYVIATSLSGFGTPDASYEIEHIRPPELMPDTNTNDRNNHLNDYHDDRYSENKDVDGAFSRQAADTRREV